MGDSLAPEALKTGFKMAADWLLVPLLTLVAAAAVGFEATAGGAVGGNLCRRRREASLVPRRCADSVHLILRLRSPGGTRAKESRKARRGGRGRALEGSTCWLAIQGAERVGSQRAVVQQGEVPLRFGGAVWSL